MAREVFIDSRVRAKATTERGYIRIPQEVLDRGWNKAVHVEGWPASYRFFYKKTENGAHTICSSKGNYETRNNLMYTHRYQPR